MLFQQNGARADRPRIPAGQPLQGPGMWVWYVPGSSKEQQALISDLKRSGMRTVFIKSADGTRVWRQFDRSLVERFQAAGIHVCAWHYVYGDKPLEEARASAAAYRSGAECFVVDAEVEYKGRARQAGQYMDELRRLTSPEWLIGLSSFPYISYHLTFPYRTFLAPGRATVNLPQMYWKEIGRSPERVVNETYAQNVRLGRPVYPIGQTWEDPDPAEIKRFQAAISKAGAKGWSWWDWRSTSSRGWQALGRR